MFTEMQVADGSINHLIIDLHAHPQLKPLNSGDSERDLLEIGLNKMKVRELMYGYDPQELTEKLMSKNILDLTGRWNHHGHRRGPRLMNLWPTVCTVP